MGVGSPPPARRPAPLRPGVERHGRVPNDFSELVADKDGTVTFAWHDTDAKSVKVSGSFNQWGDPVPMERDGDRWRVVLKVPEGRHE